MLCICVMDQQKHWEEFLPLVEFVFNNNIPEFMNDNEFIAAFLLCIWLGEFIALYDCVMATFMTVYWQQL